MIKLLRTWRFSKNFATKKNRPCPRHNLFVFLLLQRNPLSPSLREILYSGEYRYRENNTHRQRQKVVAEPSAYAVQRDYRCKCNFEPFWSRRSAKCVHHEQQGNDEPKHETCNHESQTNNFKYCGSVIRYYKHVLCSSAVSMPHYHGSDKRRQSMLCAFLFASHLAHHTTKSSLKQTARSKHRLPARPLTGLQTRHYYGS